MFLSKDYQVDAVFGIFVQQIVKSCVFFVSCTYLHVPLDDVPILVTRDDHLIQWTPNRRGDFGGWHGQNHEGLVILCNNTTGHCRVKVEKVKRDSNIYNYNTDKDSLEKLFTFTLWINSRQKYMNFLTLLFTFYKST